MVDHRHQAFFSTLLTQLPSSLINFPFRVDIHLSWTGEREAQGVAYKKKKKKRRADEEDPLEDVHVAPLTDSWTQKRKRWGSVFTWERRPRPTSPRDVSRTRNEMLSRIVHAVSGWTERRRSCHESGSPFSRSANRSTDREPHGEESIIEERSD